MLFRFFEQENERYKQRKEIWIEYNQIQNLFNYVTSMRWLKTIENDIVIISNSNLEKVTNKYNYSPQCIERLVKYSQKEHNQVQWIPFLSLALSLASTDVSQSVTRAIDLHSIDGIIINIPDTVQILQYYARIDQERGDQLRDLVSSIEQQSNDSDEVSVDTILQSNQMIELSKPLQQQQNENR
jgi:hypothetical protein